MIAFLLSIFKRVFLFQFIFVFAFLKIRDISKSSYELKDKYYELATLLNFKHPLVEKAFSDPLLVFQIFIGLQVFSAVVATLGSRFFSFLSAVLLIISSVLYFNPMKVRNNVITPEKFNFSTFSLESLLLLGVSIGIFTQTFSRSRCNSHVVEAGVTPNENKRENKPASSKKKRTL
jgi:hypothetical protein